GIFGFCRFANKADSSHVLFITGCKAIMENSVLEYYLMDENWIKENNSYDHMGNDRRIKFIR
ncbi:hypothetical protein ACJX0J_039294, partial [Zea mays]